MEKSEIMLIQCEIGFYGDSDEYYVRFNENQSKYDDYFGEGLLFADFALKTIAEYPESLHVDHLVRLLIELTSEDIIGLSESKEGDFEYDPDKGSPEDKGYILELQYSKDKHDFFLEEKGFWQKNETKSFDSATAVMILALYLANLHIHNPGYLEYLSEIANSIGTMYGSQKLEPERTGKYAFMITLLAYDNYLNNISLM